MTIEKIVPREEIEKRFGSMLAVDPIIFKMMIYEMASEFNVDTEELGPWIMKVLIEMKPYID